MSSFLKKKKLSVLIGASRLKDSSVVSRILSAQHDKGGWVAAICAAPAVVLAPLGILDGKRATCYPAPQFTSALKGYDDNSNVVVDGNVITSRGPGTGLVFSIELVRVLYGDAKATEIANQMLVPWQ